MAEQSSPVIEIRRSAPSAVMSALESADFSFLIGVREDARIEFKEELNLKLDSDKHKLAKSVSSLANTKGGVIIVGVKTERHPHVRADYAATLIYTSSADETPYYKTIAELLYPLTKITTRVFGSSSKFLIAISVEAAGEEAPILVTKTVGETLNGGTIFGYYKRDEMGLVPAKYAELHALIQAGQRLQNIGSLVDVVKGLNGRMASIERALTVGENGRQR